MEAFVQDFSSGSHCPPSLRRVIKEGFGSWQAKAGHRSDQLRVWMEIRRKHERMGVSSETGDMSEAAGGTPREGGTAEGGVPVSCRCKRDRRGARWRGHLHRPPRQGCDSGEDLGSLAGRHAPGPAGEAGSGTPGDQRRFGRAVSYAEPTLVRGEAGRSGPGIPSTGQHDGRRCPPSRRHHCCTAAPRCGIRGADGRYKRHNAQAVCSEGGADDQDITKEKDCGTDDSLHARSDASDPAGARQLVEALRRRALDLPFAEVGEVVEITGSRCDYQKYDGNDPLRWLVVQAGQHVEHDGTYYRVKPKHVVAFSTYPGDGCEDANFGLALYPAAILLPKPGTGRQRMLRTGLKGWCWSSFCKTQYASSPQHGGVENFLRCHLSVIRMLDHAKELGILGSVSDEGDFWEKRDVKALAREVGEWNEQMAGLVGQLKDMFGGDFQAPITQFPDFEHLGGTGHAQKKK